MTEIRFYHLQRQTVEQALPALVNVAYERGHRILIVTATDQDKERLSEALWTTPPQGFLPHGIDQDGNEGQHPIFITTDSENFNKADVLITTAGAQANIDGGEYKLCCDLFDGGSEEAVATARTRWKQYKEGGHTLVYYQQDTNGKWTERSRHTPEDAA